MNELRGNFLRVEERIVAACRAAGRARSSVQLMAVSKTCPAETLAEAAALGLHLFGENRVQEFQEKSPRAVELWTACGAKPVVHLIGHLQSNKAARAVELFDAVDSLDSLRLALRLEEAAAKLEKQLPVLLEIKLSDEETKAGLDPASEEAVQLLEQLPDFKHLHLRGLMTIAPLGVGSEETRACFRTLRELRDRWARAYPRLDFGVLSMGMSGDFPLAIAEGATRIRVGSALFGARSYAESN